MSQPESALSRRIMNALRAEGYFCNKNHGNEHMMAGLPDITVCAEGLYITLETKLPSKRHNTSPRQEFVHEQIRAAGGIAEVVTSVDEALAVVRRAIAHRT
jgi:hypothetical protein